MRAIGVTWYRYYKDSSISHRSRMEPLRMLDAVTRPRERAAAKTDMPLWSPALYAPETTKRGNNGVVGMGAIVLDYDSGVRPEEGCASWTDVMHAWAPSYQSTPEAPRWRLIVPVAADVAPDAWPHVWRWAAARSPGADEACKDLSRAYYVPCHPAEGEYRRGIHHGRLLDVSHIRPPPRMAPTERRTEDRGARIEQERDPAWRAEVALRIGARVTGDRAKGAKCPGCGRPSVWWLLTPSTWSGAACDHRQSCGWSGGIGNLEGATT
jgi:hypothetical protein